MTEDHFDYIVTGAGSAGCVVAARLSESSRHRVLLLEAGGKDSSPWIEMPMGYAKLFANPKYNWMYESEPEPAMAGRRLYQPRGKVLGGSSSINGMIYMRGHPRDYDEWRQRGCTGWDWDSVLPYFRKSENQARGESASHGVRGPLHVSDLPYPMELADRWVDAAVETGLPRNADFNDGEQDGAGLLQVTTRNRRRWSSASAYLRPAQGRPNLTIATHAQATRIVIENGRATGVAYEQQGAPRVAHARGEVIVCGGAFNSPQLLQLSGLGPGALLQDLGIPVLRDMPAVGADLQDHLGIRLQFRCAQPVTLNDSVNSFWRRIMAGAQYFLFHAGPLSTNGLLAGAYARSDPRLDRPDLQLTMNGYSFASRDHKGVHPHPFSGFSVSTVHLTPDARGHVHIKSPDPKAPPEIRLNFLQTGNDVRAMIASMRLTRRIVQQPALSGYFAGEIFPGDSVASDAEMEDCLRRNALSNQHQVGTCRMGPHDDAVVDPRLRVHGVDGLRVVDASVMPTVPAGNTNAPVMMIGEKASEMILEDARSA